MPSPPPPPPSAALSRGSCRSSARFHVPSISPSRSHRAFTVSISTGSAAAAERPLLRPLGFLFDFWLKPNRRRFVIRVRARRYDRSPNLLMRRTCDSCQCAGAPETDRGTGNETGLSEGISKTIGPRNAPSAFWDRENCSLLTVAERFFR